MLAAAIALAASPQQFLLAHQQADRGFAEPGGRSQVALTAWALLGLRAAHVAADDSYVRNHESELHTPNDLALGVLAEEHPSAALVQRLEQTPTGGAINAKAWKLIALAQAGRTLPSADVRFLRSRQSRSGGWSWAPGIAADSNDTAAVIEALRAAGVSGSFAGCRTATAASSWLRAAAPTRSRRHGRSRRFSQRTGDPARRRTAISRTCGARTVATATARATARRRFGSRRKSCRRSSVGSFRCGSIDGGATRAEL
jgi:hypothetical protein